MKSRRFRTMDLFCGCGGLTEGFALAGEEGLGEFECVSAMDNWDAACRSFTENFGIEAQCQSVSEKTVEEALSAVGDIDVLVGGPPCQGFSTSGKRALDDPRNGLVKAFVQSVKIAQPKAFLMENVRGFSNFQNGRTMFEVISWARELGYKVFPGLVLASLVGVPQRRKRFIMVGLKEGEFMFPGTGQQDQYDLADQTSMFDNEPGTTGLVVDQSPEDGTEQWSFFDAVSDLPVIEAGESSDKYATSPQNEYQRWAREGADSLLRDHVTVKHKSTFIEMMSYIPPGESALSPAVNKTIPEAIRPKSGIPNSYARIVGELPAPTITRKYTTPSSANCIHPNANRGLSIREGARCQSFPDRFIFAGNLGDKRLQIGNAVPPLLGRALGVQLLRALTGFNEAKRGRKERTTAS